jgi:hypothetical protein
VAVLAAGAALQAWRDIAVAVAGRRFLGPFFATNWSTSLNTLPAASTAGDAERQCCDVFLSVAEEDLHFLDVQLLVHLQPPIVQQAVGLGAGWRPLDLLLGLSRRADTKHLCFQDALDNRAFLL